MSYLNSPTIVKNNLILCLDANNPKSYNSSENLLLSTTNLGWVPNNTPTRTLNAGVAPDGTTTAIRLDLDSGFEGYYTIFSLTGGLTYTYSLYVKYISGKNTFYFGCDTGNLAAVNFNAQTGVATSRFGSPTNITSTNVGNGWYRISFSLVPPSTGNYAYVIYSEDATALSSFVWGPQVENSPTANTYTPTTTTAVTRSTTWLDLSGNGNNFSLNNMIYSSGQFIFNGTNSYAQNTSRNWIPNYFTICIFAKDWTSGMLASSLHFVSTDHNGWRLETDAARTWHELYPENIDLWSFTSANWNMFSYSHSATQTYSSINGAISNTTNANRVWNTTFSRMDIGRYTLQDNFYLNGKISMVLAYDRNLTAAELMQNFSAIRGRYSV